MIHAITFHRLSWNVCETDMLVKNNKATTNDGNRETHIKEETANAECENRFRAALTANPAA